MEKLMLIDGHSIMNRAFYALPLLTNKDGQFTNAVYGFLNMFFKLIEEENPKYIGVSFDLSKPTFRHLKCSEYKGNRKKSPEEFRSQIPIIKEILRSMNINIYEKEGFEADDVLATIAKKADNKNISSIIVTGDRDLLQVASENIKIKIPKTKGGKTETENYFAKDVFEKYGVSPSEFIDVKALMGDVSDNVPGVPSIGEKTAIKIINEYKTVEEAILNVDNIKPKKIADNLIKYKDQAILSKYLVTIDTDVPIDFFIDDALADNIFNEKFFEMCKKYELKSILSKFKGIEYNNEDEIEFNLIESIEKARCYFESLKEDEENAYKIIYDDNIFLGISFSNKYDFGSFIKVSNDLSDEELLSIFKPFFEGNYKKITLNAKQDIVFLNKKDIKLNNVIFDVMIGAYILNSTKNKYEYNDIAEEFLEKDYISKEDLLGKLKSKKFLFDVDKKDWIKYCGRQSYICFIVKPIMENIIKNNNQQELFYNIEMPLIEVLASMEICGIKASEEELMEYRKELEEELEKLTKEIYWLCGMEFNINSPKQLGEVLFDKLGLKGSKKTTTGWSTSADILEKLKDEHEVIQKILTYRTYAKLKSTYAEGLLGVIDKETGRIYSNFNQTSTATGRISSVEPNLQNIPIKIELGHRVRKVFKPENDDFIFIDADYSQIELRVLAHLSKDENLIKAFNEEQDIHRLTAANIFGKDFNEVTSFERSAAKAINFGLIYGKQAFTLSQELGITKKQAESHINEYFEKYPKIKGFLERVVNDTKNKGYVETIFNRIRYVPEINSSNFMQRGAGERIAMNMPIQGAAADIIKIAMIKVYNRIKKEKLKSRLILQVHDELLIETHKEEISKIKNILKDEMEDVIDFSVKLLIDISEGESWYDAK